MSLRIEDYALIGDCETAALVGRNGSIDWLCWPRFDSDACFAALLGTPENGRWLIAPTDDIRQVSRSYRRDTLILETRLETDSGSVKLIDFMPLRGENSDVVRIICGERGAVNMHTELVIRFGYGRDVPWVTRQSDGTLRAIVGPDMIVLTTPLEIHGENLKTVGDFTVREGDRIPMVLTFGHSHLDPPEQVDAETALEDTETFWTNWSDQVETSGEYSDAIRRSLITLKALTYTPTGGIVAAPTTSLPERIGGVRNWDYRYCWLRDATLTLLALMNSGHFGEAEAWRDWLVRAAAGAPDQTQILYGIAGERRIPEWEIPWLSGYEGSTPVRIGNAAHEQLQLDVFGEVMDALHHARLGGLPPNEDAWAFQRKLLVHLESIWNEPDEGLWEIRSERRHFTFSKVMTWVAFDRGIKGIEQFGLDGPLDRWRELRDHIRESVCRRGYNAKKGCFVQSYESDEVDASLLLLPTVGFISIDDERMVGTVAAIEQELMADGLVLRYDTSRSEDGLPPGEGAFLACSFWLADVYVMMGRVDEARALFERLLSLRNDVGLLAEEYDALHGRQVGNFPQAFSHVTLVNTAYNLSRLQKPSEQRAAAGQIDVRQSEAG